MFTYNVETKESLGIYSERLEELKNIALNSNNENELFELLKIKHTFINREIALNTNLTEKIMEELLSNHIAATMCLNLATNKNITEKIKNRLYEIADNEYKESKIRFYLDKYFIDGVKLL